MAFGGREPRLAKASRADGFRLFKPEASACPSNDPDGGAWECFTRHMAKVFRSWEVDQGWLIPPSLHEFVPPTGAQRHPEHWDDSVDCHGDRET